jgi:natural product precursor
LRSELEEGREEVGMKNEPLKKLQLNKETVRELTDSELKEAAGGAPTLTLGDCWCPTFCGSGLNCW